MQQDPSASPTPDIGHPDTAFDQNKSLGIRNDIDFGAESSRPTSSLSTQGVPPLNRKRLSSRPTVEMPTWVKTEGPAAALFTLTRSESFDRMTFSFG